ncbi:MAG: ABC transporter ATP-binding protein [Thermoplasmata archaeon]
MKAKNMRTTLKEAFKFAIRESKPIRKYQIVIIAIYIINSILTVLFALYFKKFGNALSGGEHITNLFITILLLGVCVSILSFAGDAGLEILKRKAQVLFFSTLYRKLLNTQNEELKKSAPGEYLSKILSDTVFVGMFAAAVIPALLVNIIRAITYFIALFIINFYIGILILLFLPVLVVMYIYEGKLFVRASMSERKSYAALTESLRIKIESLSVIKNFGVEREMLNMLERDGEKWYGYVKKVLLLDKGWAHTYSFLLMILPIIVLYFIQYVSVIEMGTAIVFLYLLNMVLEPLIVLSTDIGGVYQAIPPIQRMQEILDLKEIVSGNREIESVNEINLAEVFYSYGKDTVLNGVSLKINRGERIAIVGKSGSGKSTLVNIITGIYTPKSGECYINNIPIRQYNVKQLRKKIILCTANDGIFPGTVLENITLFVDGFSKDEIERVWEAVSISKELGLNERIGPGIREISDGQRQRICVARALLRKPDVLILDEALSGVEPKVEERIMEKIKEEVPTIIVISHRLSTILQMDKICVIEDGEIAEIGKTEEIKESEGFIKLMKMEIVK